VRAAVLSVPSLPQSPITSLAPLKSRNDSRSAAHRQTRTSQSLRRQLSSATGPQSFDGRRVGSSDFGRGVTRSGSAGHRTPSHTDTATKKEEEAPAQCYEERYTYAA